MVSGEGSAKFKFTEHVVFMTIRVLATCVVGGRGRRWSAEKDLVDAISD